MTLMTTSQARENFLAALATLRASKVRTALTVIGIIIGVSSVISMAAIIQGLNKFVQDRVESLGSRTYFVSRFPPGSDPSRWPESIRTRKYFDYSYASFIRDAAPHVKVVTTFGTRGFFFGDTNQIIAGGRSVEKVILRLGGIDLRPDEQLETFATIAKIARSFDVSDRPTEPWRYYSSNDDYGVGDALTLHGMLRHLRPMRIVAVGGGYAQAMILDTVEHYLGGRAEVTFIERNTEALHSVLRAPDHSRVHVITNAVQDVAIDAFTALQAGDVLVLESSHVLKTGSDVAWVYANLLPNLNPGVYVQIHSIFYPFEYPHEWVMEGRAFNELYVLRAFLALNSDFEIVLFNDWLSKLHEDRIAAELPAMSGISATALWLRRTSTSRPVLAP